MKYKLTKKRLGELSMECAKCDGYAGNAVLCTKCERQAVKDAASVLGRSGGNAKSKAKTKSSRANGKLGGRPKGRAL